jgi:alkylation response protein AidB-like acyl-CoA dehydrogenase
MALILTEEQRALVTTVRQFVRTQIAPRIAACDEAGECPPGFFDSGLAMGLHMLEAPAQLGGAGVDFQTAAMVFEELGWADAGYANTLVSTANALRTVIIAGTREQAKLFAEAVAPGGLGALVLSEAQSGSDLASIRTTAVRDGDEYVLNGRKTWITNGAISAMYVVVAKTDPTAGNKGMSAFIVETSRAGVSWGRHEEKLGLRTSNTTDVAFDDVRVPADHLIGAEGAGFKIVMRTLDAARAFLPTICVGMMQRALDEAVRYAQRHVESGRPAIQSQLVQGQLAGMAAKTEAARCLVHNTMGLLDAGQPVPKEGAITKMLVTDLLQDVVNEALQVLGSDGAAVGRHPVERIARDAKVFQIMEGTNQINAIVIGRALDREYA